MELLATRRKFLIVGLVQMYYSWSGFLAHPVHYCSLCTLITSKTRFPSNLRPTTRECVHLVTHGHDKDGGHTIRCRHNRKPRVALKFHCFMFYRTGEMAIHIVEM